LNDVSEVAFTRDMEYGIVGWVQLAGIEFTAGLLYTQ